MEARVEITVYEVRLYCDKCGTEMILNGVCRTFPSEYSYKCIACGDMVLRKETFPRIELNPGWE